MLEHSVMHEQGRHDHGQSDCNDEPDAEKRDESGIEVAELVTPLPISLSVAIKIGFRHVQAS
jgi:hypothetical protein